MTEIRRGDERDVPGIAAVDLATRRTAYRGTTAQRTRRSFPTVHGFVHVGPDGDGAGEVYAIHVHRDEQGTGVGRRLLAAAAHELQRLGNNRARLWLLPGSGHTGAPSGASSSRTRGQRRWPHDDRDELRAAFPELSNDHGARERRFDTPPE